MQKKGKSFLLGERAALNPCSLLTHPPLGAHSQPGAHGSPDPLAVPTIGAPVDSSSVEILEGSGTSSTACIRNSITAHSATKSVTFSGSGLSDRAGHLHFHIFIKILKIPSCPDCCRAESIGSSFSMESGSKWGVLVQQLPALVHLAEGAVYHSQHLPVHTETQS